MSTPDYQADVARLGLEHGVDREGGQTVYCFSVRCSCGEVGARRYRTRPPPESVHKQFMQSGWITGKRPMCPPCRQQERENRQMLNGTKDQNLKHTRVVMAALEERFDEEAGRYRRGGDGDEAIAKETNLSPDFVRSVREKAFGPLKAPPELVAIGDEIKTVRGMLDELQGRFNKLMAKHGGAA